MTPEKILDYLRYKQSCEGRKAIDAAYGEVCQMYIARAQLIAGIIDFIEMHGGKL